MELQFPELLGGPFLFENLKQLMWSVTVQHMKQMWERRAIFHPLEKTYT